MLLTADRKRQPGGGFQARSSASRSPAGRGSRFGARGARSCRRRPAASDRSLQRTEVARKRTPSVAIEPFVRRHPRAGLDPLEVGDPLRESAPSATSVPAPMSSRLPTCVRSGPRRPPRSGRGSYGRRRSARAEQRQAARCRLRRRGAGGRALPGAPARGRTRAGGSTTTCSAIRACCSPQNSAHWPRCRPGSPVSEVWTRPGTMSTLPASAGTQKLWITSPLSRPSPTAVRPANAARSRDDSAPRAAGRGIAHLPPPHRASMTPTIGDAAGRRRRRRRRASRHSRHRRQHNQRKGHPATDDPAPREAPRPRRRRPPCSASDRPGQQRHRRDERAAPRRRTAPSRSSRDSASAGPPRRRISTAPDPAHRSEPR